MGLFNFYRFCFAIAFVSLVVSFFPSFAWDITKPSPTTPYYVLDESKIKLSDSRDLIISNKGGQYSTTAPRTQNIQYRTTIEAINKSSSLKGRFLWSNFQVRNVFRSIIHGSSIFKFNPKGFVISSLVLEGGLLGYDLIFGDDGVSLAGLCQPNNIGSVCQAEFDDYQKLPFYEYTLEGGFIDNGYISCRISYTSNTPPAEGETNPVFEQIIKTTIPENSGGCETYPTPIALTDQQIDLILSDKFLDNLDDDTWSELLSSGELDVPHEFIIDDMPPIKSDPFETLTTNNITGSVSKDVSSWDYNFDFLNNWNDTNYPSIKVNETLTNDRYVDGELVGSDTITNISPPSTGDDPVFGDVAFDIQECRDFPESCSYYAYMKEGFSPPPDVPLDMGGANMGDLDLSNSFNYDFNTGVEAVCPSPLIMDLGQFGSPSLSYEPLCQVAEDTRPFVITSAIIFSILILLGSARKV